MGQVTIRPWFDQSSPYVDAGPLLLAEIDRQRTDKTRDSKITGHGSWRRRWHIIDSDPGEESSRVGGNCI